MPGRYLGLNTLHDGAMLVFDADDGTNGRQLWASDGTPNGTTLLGPVEIVQPVPWSGRVAVSLAKSSTDVDQRHRFARLVNPPLVEHAVCSRAAKPSR